MKRLFTVAFFACGWIGLLLNLVFILVSFNREAEVGSALEAAMEAICIGGVTMVGIAWVATWYRGLPTLFLVLLWPRLSSQTKEHELVFRRLTDLSWNLLGH
jgi:hypothetical protein